MSGVWSPLRNTGVAAVVVAVVAIAVYANTLDNRFAYDDVHVIQTNESIHSLETLPAALVSPYWPVRYGRELGLWRPVTTGTLGLLWVSADGDPRAFHAANILLHAAVSVALVLLAAELLSVAAAFLAGLIFAVHPVHVEAVANSIGIAELLAALFVLAAGWLHLRGPDRTGWPRALAVSALYALAFGAKESAVTFIGIVFLLDAARERLSPADLKGYIARRWRLYVGLLVVAWQMLLYRYLILGSVANPLGPLGADLLREVPRIYTLGDIWTHYVRLWVLPLDLSAEYAPGLIPISLSWHPGNVTGVVVTLATLVAAWIAWRVGPLKRGEDSARAAAFGVLWFVIVVSPVSNVLFVTGVLLAERTLYLPSVGLAIASGWALVRLAERRRTVAIVSVAAIVIFGGWRTWTRNPTWQDNQSMFNTLIAEVPQSGRSQWVLGDVLLGRGQDSRALFAYRAAVNLLGTDYILLTEVTKRLIDHGHWGAARHLAFTAWREQPHYSVAPSLLAIIASEQGRPEEAERMARISLTMEPGDAFQTSLLTWALAAQGRIEEAERAREGASGLLAEAWQTWIAAAYIAHSMGDTAAVLETLQAAEERAILPGTAERITEVREALTGTNEG